MKNRSELKILIVGGDSFIGKGLAVDLKKDGHKVISTSRRIIDQASIYLDLENFSDELNSIQHDILILCAGITGFEQCEINEKVTKINYESVKKLVDISNINKSKIIYMSSPAVSAKSCLMNRFHAIGNYGYLKKKSEEYIRLNSSRYVIARIGKILERDDGVINEWRSGLERGLEIRAFHNHVVPYISFFSLKKILTSLCTQENFVNKTFSVHCSPKSYYQIAVILKKIMKIYDDRIVKVDARSKIKDDMVLFDFEQLNKISHFGKYSNEQELELILNNILMK